MKSEELSEMGSKGQITEYLQKKITIKMSAIILLLLVSIGIAGGFLLAFFWSVKDGQFDDDFSPSRRILFDETTKVKSE